MPVAASASCGDANVVGPFDREDAEVRMAAHQHDLDRAIFERELGLLRHDRDLPRRLAPRQLIERPIAEQHAARGRAAACRSANATAWSCRIRSARECRRAHHQRGGR